MLRQEYIPWKYHHLVKLGPIMVLDTVSNVIISKYN